MRSSAKLKKLDLVNTRFAAQEREKRKQEISEEIYNSVNGDGVDSDTKTTTEAFGRLGTDD